MMSGCIWGENGTTWPDRRGGQNAHAMRESQMGIGSLEVFVRSKPMDRVLDVLRA